jgi:DNA mismatch repair protein MutL
MSTIHILSELVANKIAAGEVVERPAAVVKELIENALDAGASRVCVAVRHGGKSLISVQDNGHGMGREDAQRCLLRHATSKIVSVEDIEAITTLGFRGEALPSIASVSRLVITTRTHQDQTAWVVSVSGGVVESISESVADTGTTVTVADLFFNTPARKKFLKSDAAEYNAIADIFNTIALAHCNVSFQLRRNDAAAADYPACTELIDRIRQQYGAEFANRLYPFALHTPDLRVSGYIGSPDTTRINRTGQKFFVNGRPVTGPALHNALSRAYDEFTEPRRFPVAVLMLEIDPAFVDVNVHPTKREVRIRNERLFIDALVQSLRSRLREKGFLFDRAPAASADPCAVPTGMPPFLKLTGSAADCTPTYGQRAHTSPPERAFSFFDNAVAPQPHQTCLATRPALPFGITQILGQMHAAYLLAESAEGLVILDQHAAHERILFEALCALPPGHAPAQMLAFPLILHLGLTERELLEERLPDFQDVGFEINPLGSGTYSVSSVPVCLQGCDVDRVLQDALQELQEKAVSRMLASRREQIAAALACKTRTVKAGKHLDHLAIEHLVQQLGACANPHTCPHGRPTMYLLSLHELERRLKRT